mmetsp:Transcript_3668/g.7739  ORF Transcript_3668/g.7739 Transcript_3668/m.7739 type:complete len:753 (+) Transcript_3668:130-2388(+)
MMSSANESKKIIDGRNVEDQRNNNIPLDDHSESTIRSNDLSNSRRPPDSPPNAGAECGTSAKHFSLADEAADNSMKRSFSSPVMAGGEQIGEGDSVTRASTDVDMSVAAPNAVRSEQNGHHDGDEAAYVPPYEFDHGDARASAHSSDKVGATSEQLIPTAPTESRSTARLPLNPSSSSSPRSHGPIFQFGSTVNQANQDRSDQVETTQNQHVFQQMSQNPNMMIDQSDLQRPIRSQQEQLSPQRMAQHPQVITGLRFSLPNPFSQAQPNQNLPNIFGLPDTVSHNAMNPFNIQNMNWNLPTAQNNGELREHRDRDHLELDEADDDEDISEPNSLIGLLEDHQWVPAFHRMASHPEETTSIGIQGRTPLHVACDHDAPAWLVQAILAAWPEAAERVGTSYMNPLHITCSSTHASNEIVEVLLQGCRNPLRITGARDVDGDTALHAACRCAAPMSVLLTLLRCNPITVLWRDYEGLNPIMRLWVRYFVICGEQVINGISQPSDLTTELQEAWRKSVLLLQFMVIMHGRESGDLNSHQRPFRVAHAVSSVDCPRCVVLIATVLFPQDLLTRDEHGRLPIHIAASAPVYAVHDLRGEGYTFEDAIHDDIDHEMVHQEGHSYDNQWYEKLKQKNSDYREPSVIDILLAKCPAAASQRDFQGQLPLHTAVMRGKTLDEGVSGLVQAYPDALTMPDKNTNLYPFMLAASVGRGRGDCTTIFELLRGAPDLVNMALIEHTKPSGKAVKNFASNATQKHAI